MRIYIQQNQPFSIPIRWVFDLLATNKKTVFEYVPSVENADFTVSVYSDSDVYLDLDFYRNLNRLNTINNNEFPIPSLLSIIRYPLKIIHQKRISLRPFFISSIAFKNTVQQNLIYINVSHFHQVGKLKRGQSQKISFKNLSIFSLKTNQN